MAHQMDGSVVVNFLDGSLHAIEFGGSRTAPVGVVDADNQEFVARFHGLLYICMLS